MKVRMLKFLKFQNNIKPLVIKILNLYLSGFWQTLITFRLFISDKVVCPLNITGMILQISSIMMQGMQ